MILRFLLAIGIIIAGVIFGAITLVRYMLTLREAITPEEAEKLVRGTQYE